MPSSLLLLPVLLPIFSGCALYFTGKNSQKYRKRFVATVVMANSLIIWLLILFCSQESFHLFTFIGTLDFKLRLDGIGRVFAGLIATLWPLATFYAFGYMAHEHHKVLFYSFFIMSYGVTIGVAFSANMLTLYCFYELLTLVTVPLVMHSMTKEAVYAVRMYLAFCIGGAAVVFLGIAYLSFYGVDATFLAGGSLSTQMPENLARVIYVIMFLGFGVKAAVCPFHKWLPIASVAPTPVTALLHAVAVVKSGVFAIMRLTFFCFDPEMIRGTWAQNLVMCIVWINILFGSYTSLRKSNWKHRLAYSTVSNLSYIMFGVTQMTVAGLSAALLHMLCHASIKILSFFGAGSVLCMTGRRSVLELEGLGRKMPITFGTFFVSALALTGIPPFNGFFGKWALLRAGLETGTPASIAGVVVILISALLTAMYMLLPAVRAFFPRKDVELTELDDVREAPAVMWVPMVILAVTVIMMGAFINPISGLLSRVAAASV